MPASRFRINSNDLPTVSQQPQNCQQQSLPEELGAGQSTLFQLAQGLNYIETRYSPTRDLAILSHIEHQQPQLVITLGLQGHSRFSGRNNDEFSFNKGYTTITAFKASDGERQYEANKPTLQLRLSITKPWLDNYFGEQKTLDLFNNNKSLLSHQQTSCLALMASKQLLGCDVAQEVRPLFMHGLAMSIVAAELAHFFTDKQQDSSRFNERDKAMAELARDILFDEFRNPPSVADLSNRVGTNQFKLKNCYIISSIIRLTACYPTSE